jgi:hypothetical protein
MKSYRLKQWYPGLPEGWKDREIVVKHTINGFSATYAEGLTAEDFMIICQQTENNPDFWEEIVDKKPLFTTEDGVNVFNDGATIWVVAPHDYNIKIMTAGDFNSRYDENIKAFSSKKAAKGWLHENKPVYSRKQILEAIDASRYPNYCIPNPICNIEILKEKLNL